MKPPPTSAIYSASATVEIVRGVDAIEADWEALAEEMGESPFLRPGWFRASSRAFGKGELEVLTVRRDGRLEGVLPLKRTPLRVCAAANPHIPMFGLIAADASARDALARAFVACAPRTALIGYLDAARPDEDRLRQAAQAAGHHVFEIDSMRSPYAVTAGSWADYEQTRSRNVRGDIRRRWRRLREEGQVVVEINTGERLPQALEEGYQIEGSGWKDVRGSAIRSREDTRQFYTEVAHWAADRGWLRLCFLRWGERPIAFHFNLVTDGILYHLKGGFDTDFARFSPSKVLHYLMLEHAFATGLHRYEFMGSDEPYKLQLASGAGAQRLLYISAPTLPARAERLGYILVRQMRCRLRERRQRTDGR